MKLDLSGTELAGPVTDDLIVRSLESLRSDDGSFLILSKDGAGYIQTLKASDGTYVLEYREGTEEAGHFECVEQLLTVQKVMAAFISYFHETDDWKTSLPWEPLGYSQEKSGTGRPTLLMVFVIALALVASILFMLSV